MAFGSLSDSIEPVYNETHHETSHESSGHGGGHEALFGTVFQENIHIATYTSMLAIIIASVIAVDFLFHGLFHLTNDTPFAKMIHAIEKELMIVGFTAFIFKIIINSSSVISGDYLYALEFADTLVPVYSFCNCFLGLFMVFLSMKQSDVWSKAFHMKLDELLDEYFEKSASRWHRMVPTAFSRLTSQLEFRIFHHIFCEMFNIHTAAIAFDEYVNCVAEKYVFSIITISPVSWCVFGLIAVFDYARLDYTHYFFECDEHNHECQLMCTTYLFVIVGGLLFLVILIFACVSRYYQMQMIRMKGINCVKMYPAFLQYFEDLQEASDLKRMKEDDLQKAVNDAKAKRSSNLNKKHRHNLFSTQDSFTIFGVSNSNKNVSKVSPDDVFNNFRNNLQNSVATGAGGGGGGASDKMSNNGKPPKYQKKKRAPSVEDEPVYQASPETFQATTELVSLAAQDKAPNITRMSIQELMHIETLQEVQTKEMEQMLSSNNNSINREGGGAKNSNHHGGLRNSISMGIKNLRKSVMMMTSAVSEDSDPTGSAAAAAAASSDLEMGTSGPSLKTSDFATASSKRKTEQWEQEKGEKGEKGDEKQQQLQLQEGKSSDAADVSASTATTVPNPSGLTLKLVSFDASRPEEMESFKEKLSASFMLKKSSTGQPSPIQQAITEAMSAAGIAHVATQLEDGTYELSVVNHSGKGVEGGEGTAFQPELPAAIERIVEGNEGSESITSTSVTAAAAAATAVSTTSELEGVSGSGAGKESVSQPAAEVVPPSTHKGHSSSGSSQRSNVFNVFLMGDPELYFGGSQGLIIFISMYLAMWLIYFLPSAIPGGWKVLTLLPGVLSFVAYTYIVKVACFLKAIFQIDNEAMLEVVEQTESSKILKRTIVEKLMIKLRSMGDEQAQIFQLFREIDKDDDNALSRQELAHYLNSLDVFFSRKKWNQVFRDICIYRNNKISFDEFSLFLFPNHGVVLAQEKKRLNKLKHRVSLKSIELVKKVNFSDKNHGH